MIQERYVLRESPRLFLNLKAPRRWTGLTLTTGGAPLGPPLSKEELQEGAAFMLSDGSELTVRLERSALALLLRLERDGEVVPGSEACPDRLTARAGVWFIGIGALNAFVGLVLPIDDAIRNLIFLIAGFYGVVGYFSRKGSYAALAIGSGFYLLTLLRSLATQSVWAIILPLAIGAPMARALLAHQRARRSVPAARTFTRPAANPAAGSSPAPAPVTRFAETIPPASAPLAPAGSAASRPPVPSPASAPDMMRDLDFVNDDQAAESVGPYEILEQIGQGGMATVYRARQRSVGRDVALKVISAAHLTGAGFLERFRREAETTAGLSDPHILKVFDYGEDGGRPYLAMEFMRGGSLRSRITGTPLQVPQVLKWAEQVGQAIQSAHRQGVVHRDIKPENVLLDQSGNAFLADFGLARLHNSSSSLSVSGGQMGSPTYMAPEQWEGNEVSAATDLYAFGVLLYELLAGAPPFVAPNLPGLMALHLEGEAPSVRVRRAALPAGLDAFFRRALAKGPAQRFASADAMVATFRQAVRAPAPSTVPRTVAGGVAVRSGSAAKPAAPRPTPAWGRPAFRAAVVAALAIGSTFALKMQPPTSDPVPTRRPAPRPVATRSPERDSPWSAPTPALPPSTLEGEVHPLPFKVTDAAFSPVLNRILAIGSGQTAWLLDPETGRSSRIELSAAPRTVAVGPDGLTAVVGHDFAVSSLNLASGIVERVVPVAFRGPTAVMGSWAYIQPDGREPSIQSVSLKTGEIKSISDRVPRARTLRPHISGRRIYTAESHLSPEDIVRVEATLGPASMVKDSRYHGDHPICSEIWLSEPGDFAFSACGSVFALSDDLERDMEFAGQIPDIVSRRVTAFAHSARAGRIMMVTTSEYPSYPEEPRDVLQTLEFPGFRFVARDVLPRLGTEDRPISAAGQFIFPSRDGLRMYVVLAAPAAESAVASAIYSGPIR